MVRQTLKTEAIHQVVDTCLKRSPHGLVTNVPKGHVPSPDQSLARYVAQYVVSPPLSVRRIERSAGERGTSHDRSHRPERMERETVEVATCSGRLIQPTRPKGFKRIRYDGGQATKTCAKVKALMHEALGKVEGVIKGAVKSLAQLTSRQR